MRLEFGGFSCCFGFWRRYLEISHGQFGSPLLIGGEQIAQWNLPPHQTPPQYFQEKRRMPDLLKGSAVRWNETNSSRS